jgi:hypothetical protein
MNKLFLLILLFLIIFFVFFNNKNNYSEITEINYLINKLALILHVGNIDIFEIILSDYPNFFNNKQIDLYFTCNNQENYDILQKKFPESKVFKFENKGMDIGPFLLVIKYLIENNAEYNYYIKIHTKTDTSWRNLMIKPIYNQLDYFLNVNPKKDIELFGCKEFYFNGNFDINYSPVLEIIKRNYSEYTDKYLSYCSNKNKFNLNCDKSLPYFIAGTIFVFNNKYFDLLKQIKDFNLEYNILETGYIINNKDNPRKTHAWEYLFGYLFYLDNKKITII